MKRKTFFRLEIIDSGELTDSDHTINIVGGVDSDTSPYVAIGSGGPNYMFIKDKDLKTFARNLARAVGLLPILILFILVGCGRAEAQMAGISLKDTSVLTTSSSGALATSGIYAVTTTCGLYHSDAKPFTDTVACMMVVTDSSVQSGYAGGIRGYEIRRHYWPSHPEYMIINEQMNVETTGYLNAHKKPLKLFVWMSKPLTPSK